MLKNKKDAQANWRERFNNRTVKDAGAPKLEVRAAADGSTEILLYDEIGYWGVTAKDFAGVLAGITSPSINVRINSPGGDVMDGLAIYNSLKAHPATINTVVEGLAASAASFIMLAGDTVTMAENSLVMIHKAWAMGIGNADDMTSLAGVLGKIDGQIAGMYSAKNGKSAEDNLAAMAAETWMTSAEAKEFGLVDSIVGDEDEDENEDDDTEAKATARALKTQKAELAGACRAAADRIKAAYDPDGDGDDDAAEAVGLITQALGMLTDAIESLTGTEPEDEDDSAASNRVTHMRLRLALAAVD
jgi:ATP-dependent Clp endopeptidase proteolytic subunit ClpP